MSVHVCVCVSVHITKDQMYGPIFIKFVCVCVGWLYLQIIFFHFFKPTHIRVAVWIIINLNLPQWYCL